VTVVAQAVATVQNQSQNRFCGATIRSMMHADTQQDRVLARLRRAGGQPVAYSELQAGGIDFPAAVVSELELQGYAIDRVYEHGRLVGVRLLEPEPAETPTERRRAPRPWAHQWQARVRGLRATIAARARRRRPH
jgi:hypothetical protein